jgi:hypothetical protein
MSPSHSVLGGLGNETRACTQPLGAPRHPWLIGRAACGNGAYSQMRFHRSMSYTVPMDSVVGGGSGYTEIDRREQKTRCLLPNLRRYLVQIRNSL